MKTSYAERLAAAMAHAKLNQTELAHAAEMSQPSIHYLLKASNGATGSEFTARFARICGVSPDWLADEIGDMLPSGLMISEPRVAAIASTLLRAMEDGQDYLVERTQKDIAADIELIAQATARAKANDC